MKIKQLYIQQYKNLKNFSIDFRTSGSISVLIGLNGAGKSNILEAIVQIFCDLENFIDKSAPPRFKYSIEYTCYSNNLKIDTLSEDKNTFKLYLYDENKKKFKLLSHKKIKENSSTYKPKNIFGYYSGLNTRLEDIFKPFENKYYYKLLRSSQESAELYKESLRSLFYAKPIHSQFILLAFFLNSDKDESQKLLREKLDVIDLESILFIMKKPPWNSKDGDNRFWNAKGAFRDFMDTLYNLSTAPFKDTNSKEEYLYLFIKDIERFEQFSEKYSNSQQLFWALESTFLSETIHEIRIKVKIENEDGYITYKELSEGEQQLLTVLGLLKFTENEEVLFLLDEPDTHLNAAWSYEYFDMIKEVITTNNGKHEPTSQLLIATHNPLLIAGVAPDNIRVLESNERSISASEPCYDPRGLGAEGVIQEFSMLRSSLPNEVLHKMDEAYSLRNIENKTHSMLEKLDKLEADLEKIYIRLDHPNPYFDLFAEAISKQEAYKKTHFTKLEKERISDNAAKLLKEIMKENPR